MGDWGLGIGDWAQSPFIIIIVKLKFNKLFKFLFYLIFKNKNIKRNLNL